MFKLVSNRWIKIRYTQKKREPYFLYEKKHRKLDDVVRCRYNPWDSSISYPDYIHGYTDDGYEKFYIQLSQDGTAVKLYRKEI